MKFLIYFACYFVYAIITTLISYGGYTLGGLPTILLALPFFFAARYFCRIYEEKKEAKSAAKKERGEK